MNSSLRLLAFGCVFLCSRQAASAQVQRQCGAAILQEALTRDNPALRQQVLEHRRQLMIANQIPAPFGQQLKTTAIYPVPVVFHVLLTQAQYNRIGGAAGLSQRIDSQLLVLNRDYNAQNADSTKIPSVFKSLYGNAQIRFGLAKRKPDGSVTPGYEVKIISGADTAYEVLGGLAGSGFACSDAKYNSTKGFDAWDVNKYLNIWVVRITNNHQEGILGITTSPQTCIDYSLPTAEEGVVVTYGGFGTRRVAADYFFGGVIDRGRTLTHEVGHYFELSHIWGDDNGQCPGNGGTDDLIIDTPPQASEHYGCPAFPQVSCTNGPNGDMFMNYMDYTDDACMVMFTKGQSTVMNHLIQPGGESYQLTQNPGLLSVSDVKPAVNFMIAPNPTNGPVFINFAQQPKDLESIDIINIMGQHILRLAANSTGSYTADLSGMSKGLYFVQCRFADGAITQKIVLQ